MAKVIVVVADSDQEAREQLGALISALGVKVVFAQRSAEVAAFINAGASGLFIDPMSSEMGGSEILADMSGQKRVIPTVVVSSGGERQDFISAIRAGCIDWFEKPMTEESVRAAFDRIEKRTKKPLLPGSSAELVAPQARDLIRAIARKIKDGNIDLPEVPTILKDLNALLDNLDADVKDVQKIVERDPSLAARLVATVNSPTYGGRHWEGSLTDLPSTLTRLGNIAIRNLVTTEVIKGMFNFRSPAFKAVFEKMWRSHFLTACLCREIATAIESDDPEELYLMGLMHNIGELFLLRVLGEFFQKQNNQLLSMPEVLDMLRQWHTQFGESLIKKWNLGDKFAYVARYHHDMTEYFGKDDDRADMRKNLHIVNLANQLSKHVGASYYAKELPAPGLHDSYEAIGVPAETRETLRKRVEEMTQELSGV